MSECCEKRMEIYKQLCDSFDGVLYLFEEAVRSFDELVDKYPGLCFHCRWFMKQRHFFEEAFNEQKKKKQKKFSAR